MHNGFGKSRSDSSVERFAAHVRAEGADDDLGRPDAEHLLFEHRLGDQILFRWRIVNRDEIPELARIHGCGNFKSAASAF